MRADPQPVGPENRFAGLTELVVVSLEPWDDVWRRNQYLVAELLRNHETLRVLFVEPPADVLHAALRKSRPSPGRGLRQGPAVDGVRPGQLWLYQPTKLLPRRLDPGFDRRRAERILRSARRVGLRRPTLWINDLGGAPLLGKGLPVLYDVTDDWLVADRSSAETGRMVREEAALLAAADVVTVCSSALVRSKRSAGATGDGRPVLITNGVDLERYRRPTGRPTDLPDGPCAVYVGTLHDDRLDLDLCVEAAHRLAGSANLVFVGPIALEPEQDRRLRAAGATLLGPRHRDQVPAYLQHADVLLVPHLVNAFTDSLDPIKLYEYQAVGRPVVSTPVSGFRDAEGPITIAAADGFINAVVAAVTTGSAPAADPPPDLPTWSRQAQLMADQLAGAGQPAATSR